MKFRSYDVIPNVYIPNVVITKAIIDVIINVRKFITKNE